MKKSIHILLILFLSQPILAQKIISSPRKDGTALRIKWFTEDIFNKEGFNIYKKENGDWNKLNASPLGVDAPKPTNALASDKTLKPMIDMVDKNAPNEIEGIAKLSLILKAASSEAFAKYIGIQYDDEAIAKGKSAQYKVTAIQNGKERSLGEATFKMGEFKAIAPPKGVNLLKEENKIGLFWQAENDRFWGVNIYRSESANGQKNKINERPVLIVSPENEVEGAKKHYTDKDIFPKKSYYYELKAVDFFGDESEASKELVEASEDKTPPPPPEFPQLKNEGKTVELSWDAPFSELLGELKDLAGYHVYRSTQKENGYKKISAQLIPKSQTKYTDTPEDYNTYYYKIASVDQAGNEALSKIQVVTLLDKEAPKTPENFTVKSERGQIILKWKKNLEKDLDGYLVFKKIKGDTKEFARVTRKPIQANSYTDKLPENASNEFQYKITAIDTNYNFSPFTEVKGATMPDVTPPNQPFIKTVEMGENSGKVIWLANLEPDLKGYNLYRSLEKTGKNWQKLNQEILTNTEFSDANLEPQVKYYYRLQAIDQVGNKSTFSNIYMARTRENKVVKAPENVSAKFIKKSKSVQLKWKADSPELLAGAVILKRGTTGGFQPASPMLTASQFSDKDILSKSSYDYQIRLYYKNGEVAYSTPVNITIP